jgi:hypothetical protein
MSPETFARRIRSHCFRCTDLIHTDQPCEICGRPVKTRCHWLFHLSLHCECCQSYMKQREREEKYRRFVDPPCVNRGEPGSAPQSSPSQFSETRDPLLGSPSRPLKPEARR